MRTFRNIFSHLSIIFSGMFITLTILNQYNPGMGFLTSTLSMVFIFLFCLSVIALSVATILDNRRHAKHNRPCRAIIPTQKQHTAPCPTRGSPS